MRGTIRREAERRSLMEILFRHLDFARRGILSISTGRTKMPDEAIPGVALRWPNSLVWVELAGPRSK